MACHTRHTLCTAAVFLNTKSLDVIPVQLNQPARLEAAEAVAVLHESTGSTTLGVLKMEKVQFIATGVKHGAGLAM
jgi:hypothetical protein